MARGRPPELLFGFAPRDDSLTLHLRLEGRGHRLVVDEVDHGLALPELAVALSLDDPGIREVRVMVVGPEGPAWPEPVALAVPSPHDLWMTS